MSKERIALTKFETEVMSVLWRLGEASVRELQEAIDREDRPAYTTVQTIVQRLEQKGAVRRTRKAGNAFFFEPAVTRKSVYRRLVEELLDLVGGSQPLVAHLVETGKLSLDDLKAIELRESRVGSRESEQSTGPRTPAPDSRPRTESSTKAPKRGRK